MSLLVTGSIGIDTVESPGGTVKDALGGSSIYFSQAASYFGPVRLVGVVGDDAPEDFLKPLADNPMIDLHGLEVRQGSRTFRWHGRYRDHDVNERDTINVELNVLGEAGPKIPPTYVDSRYVFLANTHPALQVEMLEQIAEPRLVVADTMNLWIENERDALLALLARIDGLVLNDSEAKLLSGKANLVAAGLDIAKLLRKFVIVKKGEHGSILFMDGQAHPLPGFPALDVVDPTGAGDTFAGAMMGHLAAEDGLNAATLRRGIAYGTVAASFALEDFSLNRLLAIDRDDIERRLAAFRELVVF